MRTPVYRSGRRDAGFAVGALPSAAEAMDLATGLVYASAGALRDALDAVIVHGSLTLGGYVPGASDIDLLAVVDGPLSDGQITAWTEPSSRWTVASRFASTSGASRGRTRPLPSSSLRWRPT